MDADIKIDIMDWNYREYEPHYFDIIFASPPCTEYSIAKTTGFRDIEGANKIVDRTWDIITYFMPYVLVHREPSDGALEGSGCYARCPICRR